MGEMVKLWSPEPALSASNRGLVRNIPGEASSQTY